MPILDINDIRGILPHRYPFRERSSPPFHACAGETPQSAGHVFLHRPCPQQQPWSKLEPERGRIDRRYVGRVRAAVEAEVRLTVPLSAVPSASSAATRSHLPAAGTACVPVSGVEVGVLPAGLVAGLRTRARSPSS